MTISATINAPWTKAGDGDDDWDHPSHRTAGVSGSAPFFNSQGELVGFAVSTGWNDADAEARDFIITAVNAYDLLTAQNEWLKDRLSSLQLPATSTKNIEEWLVECGMPTVAKEISA